MDLEIFNCGDCDATEPKWASVNRGVLLCDECCSVHRQLGRYVSQVKHIKRSSWRPTQLAMFNYLVKANVNRFWEHTIYEKILHKKQLTKKETKPTPSDPIATKKREFIIAKYSSLFFMQRPQKVKLNDLNQQLHASVRTGVLETSLQLLALGANPNALHPTKGTSAVHHACENDQIGQLELLIIYGGDICSRDLKNRNAFDIALKKCLNSADISLNDDKIEDSRSFPSGKLETAIDKLKNSWTPLLDALVNSFYEIPDVFSQYLFKSSPNHKQGIISYTNGQKRSKMIDKNIRLVNGHFFLPLEDFIQGHEVNSDKNHHIRSLKNQRFQYLCTDVHDETERRSLNEIFSENTKGPDFSIPFLPINTEFSQVRNQARQKLARLNNAEFRELIIDTLLEISVRLNPIFPPLSSSQRSANSHGTTIDSTTSLDHQNILSMFENISQAEIHMPPPHSLNSSCANGNFELANPAVRMPLHNQFIVDVSQTQTTLSLEEPIPMEEDEAHLIGEITPAPRESVNGLHQAGDDRLHDDPVYDQVAYDADINANGHGNNTINISNKMNNNSPTKPSRGIKFERGTPVNNGNSEQISKVDEVTSEIVRLKQANLELKERLFQMQSAKYQYESKFGDLESEINLLKRELTELKMEKTTLPIVNNSFDSGNSFKPGMKASISEEDLNRYKTSDGSVLDMDNDYLRPVNPTAVYPTRDEPIPAERNIHNKNFLSGSIELFDNTIISENNNDLESTASDQDDDDDETTKTAKFREDNFFFNEKTKSTDFLGPTSYAISKTDKTRQKSPDESSANGISNSKWEISNVTKTEITAKSASLRDRQPGGQTFPANKFEKYLSSEHLSPRTNKTNNTMANIQLFNEESLVKLTSSPKMNHKSLFLKNQSTCKSSSSTEYASSSPTPMTKPPQHHSQDQHQQPITAQRMSYASNVNCNNNNNIPRVQKSILKNNTNNSSNLTTLPTNGVNLPVRNIKNSSDAVVQAVELIISRIRNLLDVANGRSIGSPVQLSRAIQTAVNDILILFPLSIQGSSKGPYSSLTPSLTLLRTSSISLARYCQRQQAMNSEDKISSHIKVEVIIKHAHEIARSAKEILSQYQNKAYD